MIWQIFSPGKVFSCRPSTIWWEEQLRACNVATIRTSSNKQSLFEIQKKENWTTCGYFHLLAVTGEKTGAAMLISRCGQVGKGFQVFAFRVVPRTERERWWQWRFEHLSTFPWVPQQPPIVTKPVLYGSAHVPNPPFWRVNCDPPAIKQNHNQ